MSKLSDQRRKNDAELEDLDTRFRLLMAEVLMAWGTAETWFTDILAALLKTDLRYADAILASHTSTRARIDLVNRIAIMAIPEVRKIRHLMKLCREFKAVTEMRNRLAHSQYHFIATDDPGPLGTVIALTSINFAKPNFDGTNPDEARRVDRGLLNEMKQARDKAYSLAWRLSRYAKQVKVLERPRDTPLPLHKLHKTKAPRRGPKKKPRPQRRQRPSWA